MTRTLLLVFLFSSSSVAAQGQVVVEVVQGPYQGDPTVVVEQTQQTPPPQVVVVTPPEPEPPPVDRSEYRRVVGTVAIYGGRLNLGGQSFRFREDAEIGMLRDLDVDPMSIGSRARVGGLTYGAGLLLHDWIRIPEIRLTIAGGGMSGRHATVQAEREGFSADAVRHFLLRIEALAGIEHTIGKVFTPFVRGFAAANLHLGAAAIRHDELGPLGREGITAASVSLGAEVGFNAYFGRNGDNERVGYHVAYRRSFYGPRENAVTFGIAILGER